MRLTDAELANIKTWNHRGKYIYDLCDTIETQQKELQGWESRYTELDTGHSKLFEDYCKMERHLDGWKHETQCHMDVVKEKCKEIEQLKAQNATIRQRLHSISYQSSEWSHGEHPRVVDIEEIDDVLDELPQEESI